MSKIFLGLCATLGLVGVAGGVGYAVSGDFRNVVNEKILHVKAEEDFKELEKELEDSKTLAEKYFADLQIANSEKTTLTESLTIKQAELETVQASLAEKENTINQNNQTINSLTLENENLTNQIAELGQDAEVNAEQIATLNNQIAENNLAITNLQEQNASINLSMQSLSAEKVTLTAEISSLEARIEDITNQLNANETLFQQLFAGTLTEINLDDLGDGVTSFGGFDNVTKIFLSDNCTELKYQALRAFPSLKYIKIPKTVTTFGDYSLNIYTQYSGGRLVVDLTDFDTLPNFTTKTMTENNARSTIFYLSPSAYQLSLNNSVWDRIRNFNQDSTNIVEVRSMPDIIIDSAVNGSVEVADFDYDYVYDNVDRYRSVTATPDEGYLFDGWYNSDGEKVSSNLTYDYLIDFTETEDIHLEARFKEAVYYNLNVEIENEDFGTVEVSEDYQNNGTAIYKTVRITPNDGYAFAVYKNDVLYSMRGAFNVNFTLTDDTSLKIKFIEVPTEFVVVSEDETKGAVTLESRMEGPEIQNYYFNYRTILIPATGYKIDGLYVNGVKLDERMLNDMNYTWLRCSKTHSLTRELAYVENPYVVAKFIPSVEIIATVNDENAGTATVSEYAPTSASAGSVKLTAVANEGYTFEGWYEGETLISSELEYVYFYEAGTSFVAKFVEDNPGTLDGGEAGVGREEF